MNYFYPHPLRLSSYPFYNPLPCEAPYLLFVWPPFSSLPCALLRDLQHSSVSHAAAGLLSRTWVAVRRCDEDEAHMALLWPDAHRRVGSGEGNTLNRSISDWFPGIQNNRGVGQFASAISVVVS